MSEIDDLLARRRSELASRREALSALKQQELERLLNQSVVGQSIEKVIPARPADEPAPLSFAQERLWFLYQLEPESTAYNVSLPLRITGRLNLPALSQSINEAVRRHESLRTTFVAVDELPVQVVHPARNIDLPIVDLTSLPESQRKEVVQRLVQEGGRRHFNLAEGPLFQTALFRVGKEEHVLMALLHHIIVDEWSKQLLVREVGEIYQAFDRGRASSLPELSVQYADFAHWHRQWFRDEVIEQELSYWRTQLDDSPPLLNLPVDRPRPPVMTYEGDALPIVVPEALTQQLRELTRSTGASLFMTLLASFQMLLSRYTGQDDIVVATPVAGRRSVDTEALIGFFVNTLLIRTRLSGNPRLKDVLDRVREVVLEAQTHQDLPFEKLVEALHPERSLSHGPLFEVMFVFTSKPGTLLEVQDISISLMEMNSGIEKFGLTFEIAEGFHELNCLLTYRTDLFDSSTIERLGRHWQRLLEAMVTEPDQLLLNVELLNDDEQAQVLSKWNDTAVSWAEPSFLNLFKNQVERAPAVPAIQFADQHLSYRELNARANQLAHHLLRRGAGADTRVGIYLEPSLEMVTAVLGVLKAGAAYVPLDPAYPAERLNLMLDNVRCLVLLTSADLLTSLPETEATVLCLDRDWQEIARESNADPQVQIEPENLVNVIYTSGSTGVPKGVAMTHRALGNLICWQMTALSQPARTLQFASLSFDVSFQEIFSTWCTGGTLVLVTNEQRHDVNRMLDFLSAEQVERVDLPFVYLQHLAEGCEQGRPLPASLRDIIAAGEQLECTPQIRQLCERLRCSLYNHYGPSETHVVTQHELRGIPEAWPTLAPVGRPIANAQIYILDRGLQPVPVGVAGELFIGGANVSRGYLDRPELTAERYVPNPFGNSSAERLYRTGDLARYLADGTIEFLGRIDTQVKIRGFRIELGEIEATLRKHPQVLHAIVLAREETRRHKHLVAYVVGTGGVAPNINELKSWLKERLPAYMAPTDWITLEQLPLTPSGKINRAALPAPDAEHLLESSAFSAPQTLIEELLAAIWQQVLNLERVSRDDNFFWLGGHSLLATRITSRIRDAFHVELPVRVLFESPTIAELAARIEQLTQAGTALEAPPLQRSRANEPLVLSHAQERLWFLDQLTPGSNAYNLAVAMYISTDLNVPALEQSLFEVVRRHEVLRTTIEVADGQPRPVSGSPEPVKLSLVDLSLLRREEQESHAARLRDDDALQPFDLSTGPLLRMTLIRFSADRYLLLTNMHHIVSDGWSMEVLLHEMEILYRNFSSGSPSSLSQLEVQYADYAHWQREWLQGEVLEAQVDYWKSELKGAPTLLELQPDHAPVAARTGLAANCPVVFSTEVSRSLRDFSRREGSTLFMTLMAGFHALLRRYTDQKDILIGTPIAGRSRAELEPLIGFFVNMVVLRTNFDEDPSFKDLLKQVRETALGAYAHQDVPFERLVEELKPERAVGRNPIFQVVFALQNVEQPTMQMDGVSAPVGVPPGPETKFDLELYLQDMPSGLKGSFVYSADLFEPAFVERMAQRFQRLMEKVVAQPSAALSMLSLLDEVEYHQIVAEWNDTTVALPEACIHQLFEQQVEQRPEAIALEFENEQLTYRELDQRANVLAARLRREGAGPEVFIGVMLERSAELIISLLGIAKAGGVYVPLNLTDPPKRIQFILEDAGVQVLVTTRQIAATLSGPDLSLVYIDAEEMAIFEPALQTDVTPDNLVYMMYTSGSTGTPKAVGITHRNVLRLVKGANYADLSSNEIFLQFAPVSFDASTFEIWGCLLNGARLVVFPPYLPSLAELADFVNRTQITTMWLTGGLFHQLVDSDVSRMTTLKQLLAGGEALSPVHVSKALKQLNGCRLINGYGPTETTTFACCYRIGPDFPGPSVPIGRPISNTTAYVLNAMQPTGVGERGELFIGGEGLGRGYHQRPDLTAERFMPDPYAVQPGRRLYRTGDAVRYLDEGVIRFLGRMDNQVKISGFRIEPGEIESVLVEHPAVSEALVLATEGPNGDRRLIAYFVASNGRTTGDEELKKHVQERLPSFMVPSAWIRLDELPLTPNGKVNRAALPDYTRLESTLGFQAPRTQTEAILAGIWERVLGAERIGRDDNFFSLGGYSLLATRIISRIRESFQVELPVRSIFEWPTLSDLAERIEEMMRSGSTLTLPPLQRLSGTAQLPLSYAQQRLWFIDQLLPHNNAYNIPVGFRVNGPLNLIALEQSLNQTVQRHESLRTNFVNVDGQPIQVIAPNRTHDLRIIDLERIPAAERETLVQRLALAEGRRPFDLASDPLFRTSVFRLGEQEYVLLVIMHHIVSDGWSIDVLTRDVPRTYRALAQGVPSALPELPIQYADFAHWQRQWLQGEVLEQELSYWRNQLDGSLPELNLPTDRPRPSALSLKGNAVVLEVPESLTTKLRELSQSEGSTLFITLLASFQILLARYSGQDDIAVGTPVAGRRWVETEDLIGFFVNTLVMRTRLSGDPTLREVLRRVREVTLEAQTHQDVPFEKLVEELQPQRTLSHGPLFQTMFVFLNEGERLEAPENLAFSSLPLNYGTEKNDLTLQVTEQENKLLGSLSYSTDLFDESTIRRMTAHLQHVLEAIVSDPEQLLREVDLLSTDERKEMLADWNATDSDFPENTCLHEMFEKQVDRTPDAVAVSFADQRLSYAQLDRRANQLAHYLRGAGVGPDTPVAIYLERSLDMIVALMGVLKAGGAYLPLETSHPKGRLQYVLEDAQARVILAQERTAVMLPEHRVRVICLDSDWPSVAQEPDETPANNTIAENLAYVIYTSGSTGGARGVMVQHRSVVNLANSLREQVYPAGKTPLRVSLNAPLMFDSSVKQLIQLLYGHELCVIPEDVRRDGTELVNYLRLHQIDVLDCTPSQLRLMLPSGFFESDGAPTLVLVGGEAIDDETWHLLASSKRTTFFNVYGPTECTVDTTVSRVEPASAEVLIGRPLGNVQTYLLDTHNHPIPLGAGAELFIGGAGVARGYLAEPDLTAERFVPDPFSDKAGARLYRSGDRVRYRAGGEIGFLGRLDYQVKIRGHRIELGEIEAALRKDPQVREAVVVEREERHRDKRLVAYIVAEQPTGLSLPQLQKSLREQVPDYMMPAGWVVLDEIPLTPSGKVDRAALPDPGRTRLDTGQSFVAPPNIIEEALAAIWRQVLDLDQVRNDDNFFWLGGHSLLATQIVSRIRESFQVELPVRSLFESPVLSELSERIEVTMRSGASAAAPALMPLPRDNEIPLSYAQQRLWFLNQLMPGSNAYNLPAEMSLDAGLSPGALEQSLSEVLRRHEALRTTFMLVGSHPVQRISPAVSLQLPLVDLRHLEIDEQPAIAERLRQVFALRPFDLETGPLVRAALVRSDEESLFLLNMHHIVSDGWSMGVLLHEVETLYESYSRGLPSPLPELVVQYADYAGWQREWLQGETLKEEVAFWKRQLEGAPTLLELETDHPRQFLRTLRGAHQPIVLSPEVSQWLREFHRQEGTTLFMTLMAGFHALLWRYTGQHDILVGTPIAGRSRVELESLIGFFVNMVPIRTNFSSSPTFRGLVNQVRDSSLAAYTHQELPFDKLVEELQPKRSPGRNPIFQAILAFQNAAPQMSLAKVNLPAGVPVSADIKFDLEVHLRDTPNGVMGSFVYSPELFEPAFIARMVHHFQKLFEKAMVEPDTELSTLSLLDEAEYRQVVEEWNDTAAPVPEGSIHQIFEHEVEQRPDKIAIESVQEQISYRDLNRRANNLARRLQREGVGTEVFVGVMVERSAELIVSLLGIVKAGGVYVPLNMSDPAKRIQFILEDAGVRVMVTTKQVAASLAENDLKLVYVDEDDQAVAEENIRADVTPDNLAYLMYTSGSTGTPKGVGITHRNIVGFVKAANYAQLSAEEIFMHVAPISFDASTFEIWAALLNGARLAVFPPSLPSLSELGEFIARTQVTTVFLTTGLFHQFVETNVTTIGAVRQLLTGGDALSPYHLKKGVEQIDNVRIVNCYGPTESTVMACCYKVERDRPATSVPIGRPVSNTRLYIVNAMQPAGVGERGELLIAGHGLGRGYHHRPDLTAERFLPDPYGPQPGGRLYRTGDAARYLNDGLIQFLGRVDDQIKISGFRIEPREIEAVLATHPGLGAALVVAREETPGQKFLAAYFVANSETGPTSDELRAYLKERLPEYMVPSVYVPLAAFPLTPHGKVDRAALPAPQVSLSRGGREYLAPQNDLQQQLVDIWEELFKIHPIGIADNFFELGGHSLQMIMLVARVEERLGQRVTMADLFIDPTVERLAGLIGHGKENLFQSLIVPLHPEGTQPPFFGPHASGGNVWCYRELVQHLGADQPFFGIQPREPENGLVVYHSDVEAMATDYVQAIRGFQPVGPYWLAGWSMGGVIAFEMARQLQQQGQEIAMVALFDAGVPEAEESEYKWAILLSIFALDLGLTGDNFKLLPSTARLPQMAQLRQLWVEARRAGVVPSEMTLVEFRKLFDIFKIYANITRRYRPGQFQGRVTLFSPSDDVEKILFSNNPENEPEKPKQAKLDPLKGWGSLATEGVEFHNIPGNHFSMLREPNVQVLGERLRQCIADVRARRNDSN